MPEGRLARCREPPSLLRSTTGLPTLVDSSAPCPSDPGPLPNGPEKGRSVPGGKDRPRAHGEGERPARPGLGKLSASVGQIGIRRATSVRVKQSKSRQIVLNAYASGSTSLAAGRHFTPKLPCYPFYRTRSAMRQ